MSDLISGAGSGRHSAGGQTEDSGRHGARRAAPGGWRASTAEPGRSRAGNRHADPADGPAVPADDGAERSGRYRIGRRSAEDRPAAATSGSYGAYGADGHGTGRYGSDRYSADRYGTDGVVDGAVTGRRAARRAAEAAGTGRRRAETRDGDRSDPSRHVAPTEVGTTGRRAARRAAERSQSGRSRHDVESTGAGRSRSGGTGAFGATAAADRSGEHTAPAASSGPSDPGFGRGDLTAGTGTGRRSRREEREAAAAGTSDALGWTGRRARRAAEEAAGGPTGTGRRGRRAEADERHPSAGSGRSADRSTDRPVDRSADRSADRSTDRAAATGTGYYGTAERGDRYPTPDSTGGYRLVESTGPNRAPGAAASTGRFAPSDTAGPGHHRPADRPPFRPGDSGPNRVAPGGPGESTGRYRSPAPADPPRPPAAPYGTGPNPTAAAHPSAAPAGAPGHQPRPPARRAGDSGPTEVVARSGRYTVPGPGRPDERRAAPAAGPDAPRPAAATGYHQVPAPRRASTDSGPTRIVAGPDPRAGYAAGAGSPDPAARTSHYPRPDLTELNAVRPDRTGTHRSAPEQPADRRAEEETRIEAVGSTSGPQVRVTELVPAPRQTEYWPGTGRPMSGQDARDGQWAGPPAQRGGEPSGELVAWGEGPVGVETVDLVKDYGTGSSAVRALAGISVTARSNRFTAIMGPSGSGKSTLLHCMAGLDVPTSGRVLLGPTDLTQLPEKKLTRLRRERVGFVFQSYALLPQLSVKQNITLPLEVAGRKVDGQWLKTLVDALDLGRVLKQRPNRLSGGQQQRVAMARALLPRPDVVFADEPTGALDATTAREMLQFLRTSVHELGQTIVMVTHDPLAAEHTDHVLLLHRGTLAAQIANPTAPVVLEALTVLDRMPSDDWRTGGYRAAATGGGYPGGTGVYPAPSAVPAASRLALPAGSSARPA